VLIHVPSRRARLVVGLHVTLSERLGVAGTTSFLEHLQSFIRPLDELTAIPTRLGAVVAPTDGSRPLMPLARRIVTGWLVTHHEVAMVALVRHIPNTLGAEAAHV